MRRATLRLLVETTERRAAANATDKSELIRTEANQELADPEASSGLASTALRSSLSVAIATTPDRWNCLDKCTVERERWQR